MQGKLVFLFQKRCYSTVTSTVPSCKDFTAPQVGLPVVRLVVSLVVRPVVSLVVRLVVSLVRELKTGPAWRKSTDCMLIVRT